MIDPGRRAFVIMPFSNEFDPVYHQLIKPSFEEAGFRVDRADDIVSQRNILKDVIDGIHKADVIVADVTGSNPNVYYELGVAHGLKKNVILLTQSKKDIPFDLKSYRHVEYDVHFAKIGKSRGELKQLATKVAEGELLIGDPVTDFVTSDDRGPVGNPEIDSSGSSRGDELIKTVDVTNVSKTADWVYLDHLMGVNDGYEKLATLVLGFNNEMRNWSDAVVRSSKEFQKFRFGSGTISAHEAKSISMGLAKETADFAQQLEAVNIEYAAVASIVGESLEFVIAFQLENRGANPDEIAKSISEWQNALLSANDARESVLALVGQMEDFPRIEYQLNRELDLGIGLLRRFASNIETSASSINRALKVWETHESGGQEASE